MIHCHGHFRSRSNPPDAAEDWLGARVYAEYGGTRIHNRGGS